ncbi:MAG TPA: lytic transglycosylase domain-containing protein [Acidimicrobiales bacterium]|nr:lytic transglycosylase domain-containing protein [Acidimicrobiales bacterium]
MTIPGTSRTTVGTLAVVLLVSVLLAACTDSEGPEPVSGAPSTADTAGTTTIPDIGSRSSTSSTSAPDPGSWTPVLVEGVPPVPGDAAELADRLAAVEGFLVGEPTSPDSALAAGHEQQVLLRELGRHPDWRDQVLSARPDARDRIIRTIEAGRTGATTLPPPLTEIPAWTIRDPAPVAELVGYYEEAERDTGIPWQYLAAINLVETRMGRIVGDSSAGAQGPMQFLPSTWEAYGNGGDITDDHDAIAAAARFLADHGGPTDMEAAVHAYNHSDAYVSAVVSYAKVMATDPWTVTAFHGWRVYVSTVEGTLWIPSGYSSDEPVPVAEFLRRRPSLLSGDR